MPNDPMSIDSIKLDLKDKNPKPSPDHGEADALQGDTAADKANAASAKQRSQNLSPGFDFAAAVAGLALLGYWIDRSQGSSPWGVLIGSLLGIVGGLYNAIRAAGIVGRSSNR